jgi:tripartite-type tricarboxylate transporter receptor subunit TctC
VATWHNDPLFDPKVAARIADLASTPFIATPAELDKLVIEYTEKWGRVIRGAGIKVE